MDWIKEFIVASPGVAGTVAVVVFFLKYLAKRDECIENLIKRNNEALDRVSSVSGQLLEYLREVLGKL